MYHWLYSTNMEKGSSRKTKIIILNTKVFFLILETRLMQ